MKMLRPGNLFTLASSFVHEYKSYYTQDNVYHLLITQELI